MENWATESMELKVRELLKEVQLDYSLSITRFVDDAVSFIRETIDSIPENVKVGADAAPCFIRDIGADKVDFTFKKPKSIEIGGSYSMKLITKPDVNVDLFLRMPKDCFHEKDYLNHRYHAKRCLYLCTIKKYLTSSSKFRKIEWSTFQNEARKPVLVVYPVQELAELPGFFIRIIPTATSLFNVSKLDLTRNNARTVNQEENAPQATPKYSSSILEDMLLEENAEFVRKAFLGWKELGEALSLLKVWSRNRSSIYCYDCLNGFLISAIVSYLATESGGNRINRSMKAIQIFRVTLDFIATPKLWNKGLFLQHQGQCSIKKERDGKLQARSQYLQSFPVVLCDSSAHFNLAFRMSRNGFVELRDEAALTLTCIDKCRDGGFEEVFMTKVDFPAKYDHCIRINLKGNSKVCSSGFCLDDECWRIYEDKVHLLLEQGLGDRAKFIRVTWRNCPSELTIEEGLSKFDSEPLLVGILASSFDKSFRVVDIGPNAENKEEVLWFRRFWGEKAELRRFKDGTIAESTVWECKQWERHLIIKRITEYVLSRHLSLSKDNMVHVADQLDFCLLHGVGDPISFSGDLLTAFEVLAKRLRNLEDIPLRVSSVQPLDPAFRFTSVFPPEPHPLANEKIVSQRLEKLTSVCIQPVEVMIQLEGSGNWPMDDVAIEKTKTAFLLKIGESLQNRWGMKCVASEDEVDVLMSGYAFRLRILHERGLSLLKKQVGNDQVKRVSSIDKELLIRSQHSSMINGLQGCYPTYGPVVRLAKRWVTSHLFSAYLAAEAIELLVAYLFLKPLPFQAPCSRITGFLRFLRLLSDYDWTFSPLVIDINNDLSLKDDKEISENFMLSRKSYEENAKTVEPAMFLATAYDKASEAWTRHSPNTSELRRMVAYAQRSADFLTNIILKDQMDSHRWESLFRTPLNNYDAIVLLHKDRLPYPQRLLFPSEVKLGKHVAKGNASKDFHPYVLPGDRHGNLEELKNKLMLNFDPMRCFVDDLKKEFSGTFKVWYDSIGGDAIGLTWEKPFSRKREREAAGEERRDPIDVLKDVGEVGKGFVRSIYFLKAPKLTS
ncbi:PREDICTED: nucleolar protein 6 isoform X2 [Nelumbo nucifera]|uniref:Nucleolar protein 6 isoform X2 n=1 Tax=Nelumbo nucifera TaxID=4432 RepID=A0A1U7ZZW8_NELNU|nr:PREDICTED: nucleolar protein 6 isoform X2 [Nelumbo nucifera]